MIHSTADQLSTTFAALADPTRRAIIERLADGEATVNELAEPFPITVQAISSTCRCSSAPGSSPAAARHSCGPRGSRGRR